MKESPKAEYHSIVGDKSFSVCVPKGYMKHLGLAKGDYVKMTLVDTRIIIEKAEE